LLTIAKIKHHSCTFTWNQIAWPNHVYM